MYRNFVLRKKSVIRNLQGLLLSSPLFFFYPLLLIFQFFVAGADVGFLNTAGGIIQSAVWVCFLPPVFMAVLGGQFLSKIVLTKDALFVGPYSSEKRSLNELVEVGGESGSILNGFREGITLSFSDGIEEVLYLDEYEETHIREFLNELKKLRPNCKYTYGDVIPLESRGLIKFLYQTSDADSLIVKQSKTPIEDSIFQLVNEHKKAFFSLYLSGWMLVVLAFTGLTVTFTGALTDEQRIEQVGSQTFSYLKGKFPGSFVESSRPAEVKEFQEAPTAKQGRWFESFLVKTVLVLMASTFYFSDFGYRTLLILWALIGFVLLVVIPLIRKYSPSYVFVDSQSVGKGVKFFPWDEVISVELEKNGEFADPMDGRLKIISSGATDSIEPLEMDGATADSMATTLPGLSRTKTESTTIKLDRIPDQNTRMKVLRLIERHANNAHFNEEFLRTTQVSSDIQFTDLWLSQAEKADLEVREKDDVEEEKLAISQGAKTIAGGRFKIKSVLGYGGQGTTYLAESTADDSELPEEVVVKELVMPTHADVRIIQNARLRFMHGAELLSQIDHSHIVRHFEHFIEGSNAYLVMEYIEGATLRKLIDKEGALAEEKVVDIARQILNILEYLHTLPEPVIHCDLAPDNLIVTDDGAVKLIDFDVARVDGKSSTNVVAARPAYTPPEQFRGKPVIQSDLFAMGAILHFLLKGEDPPPFGDSLEADDLELTGLEAVIRECCRFEAGDRPGSANAVKELIDNLSKTQKIVVKNKDKIA